MLRTTAAVIVFSCLFGAALGYGSAAAFLTINGWQRDSESKSYEVLAHAAKQYATDPNAKALIEETVYNFGVKDVKAEGTHDYIIKNVGTADLTLKLDRTTCSCTGIDITPTRVAPGKTAVCHLRYNADRALTGKFSQGGAVITNDPEHQEIQLIVEGVFTDPVVVRPSPLLLSKIPAGKPYTAKVRFYGFEEKPLEIAPPTLLDKEHFSLELNRAELNEIDKQDSLLALAKSVVEGTLTIQPGLPIGSFREPMTFKTNYPNHAVVDWAVTGQITGTVTVSGRDYKKETGILVLGNTVSGKEIERELLIQFGGLAAQEMSVTVKRVEPAWLQTEVSAPKDASGLTRIFTIKVKVPATAPTGNYVFQDGSAAAFIELETSDKMTPFLKIPVQFSIGK